MKPFYRLESSRNCRLTGGGRLKPLHRATLIGRQGGVLTLENRAEGESRATIALKQGFGSAGTTARSAATFRIEDVALAANGADQLFAVLHRHQRLAQPRHRGVDARSDTTSWPRLASGNWSREHAARAFDEGAEQPVFGARQRHHLPGDSSSVSVGRAPASVSLSPRLAPRPVPSAGAIPNMMRATSSRLDDLAT